MTDVLARLTQWRPGMREYHSGPEISSGHLSEVEAEGLSVALHRRAQPWQPTGDRRMGRGSWLHALFTGDLTARFHVAPGRVRVRRGEHWEAALEKGRRMGVDAVLLVGDILDCASAWRSLWEPSPAGPMMSYVILGLVERMTNACDDRASRELVDAWLAAQKPVEDSPAKAQLRAMLSWDPRVSEVSHRWEPAEVPGCVCRMREDLVAQAPSEEWYAVQLKTTEASLATWWSYWRRYVRRSSAFYRAGHRDLFGGVPFRQLLAVARFEPPYPWALHDLSDRDEDLDLCWSEEIVPSLRSITESLACGHAHGPEEKGIFDE